ncbi:MAG: hypothetical protein GY778_28865 [bacterium]|nr:hypothetical protein [bacterium]
MPENENVNEALFPAGKEYKLLCGRKVRIMPWSLKTIGLVSQRIPALIDKAGTLSADTSVVELIPEAADELAWMIAVSIEGMTEEEVAQLPADDVLGLTLAVYDECVEGPLGKIAGLTNRLTRLMQMQTAPTPS